MIPGKAEPGREVREELSCSKPARSADVPEKNKLNRNRGGNLLSFSAVGWSE